MAMTGAERQARKMARLKEQAGAARKASDKETTPLSESEQRVIAFHKAGHAVVACQLGLRIKTVSIVAGEGWQGRTAYHGNPLRGITHDCGDSDRGHRRAEKLIIVALAGPAAHAIAAPDSWSPEQGHHLGRGDYDIAKKLVFKLNWGSREIVSAHLNYLEVSANALVKGTWDAIEKVAAALLEKGTLGLDIDGVTHVVNFKLPEVAEAHVHRIGRTARASSRGHQSKNFAHTSPAFRCALVAFGRMAANG
jgi:Helicase conserved C-terminal domain